MSTSVQIQSLITWALMGAASLYIAVLGLALRSLINLFRKPAKQTIEPAIPFSEPVSNSLEIEKNIPDDRTAPIYPDFKEEKYPSAISREISHTAAATTAPKAKTNQRPAAIEIIPQMRGFLGIERKYKSTSPKNVVKVDKVSPVSNVLPVRKAATSLMDKPTVTESPVAEVVEPEEIIFDRTTESAEESKIANQALLRRYDMIDQIISNSEGKSKERIVDQLKGLKSEYIQMMEDFSLFAFDYKNGESVDVDLKKNVILVDSSSDASVVAETIRCGFEFRPGNDEVKVIRKAEVRAF